MKTPGDDTPPLEVPPTKAFLSYHFPDKAFVGSVRRYLKLHSPVDAYFYSHEKGADSFADQIKEALHKCSVFVLFAGQDLGDTQQKEVSDVLQLTPRRRLLVVQLSDRISWPAAKWVGEFENFDAIRLLTRSHSEEEAQRVAREICGRLGLTGVWKFDFEIPPLYPFDSEKGMIDEFIRGKGQLSERRVDEGCPHSWPSIKKRSAEYENPVSEDVIGAKGDENSKVVVDARVSSLGSGAAVSNVLTFEEARPRKKLYLPRAEKIARHNGALNVGVIVSGGIAPGINSVISGIVDRHKLYKEGEQNDGRRIHYPLRIYGYLNGFRSLCAPADSVRLENETTDKQETNRGGSRLGTSRLDSMLASDPRARDKGFNDILSNLESSEIDVLYVIGGDGSMRAAHALQVAARARKYDLAVIGIPKTMDNDILWVWQSFGFLSAVEKAKEFIMQLHTEAQSNPRLCVMQLFGSDSGFVVSHAALASGVVDLALIPEVPFSMKLVCEYITKRLREGFNRPRGAYGMVVMSETAIPTDVDTYIKQDDKLEGEMKIIRLELEERAEIERYVNEGRRVRGQTPDPLRTGGLKIVSRVLQHEIKKMGGEHWARFRVFTNEPRHLLRSLEPSSSDIIFGHRLGCLAVDNAMAGYTDFMISQWLTEFVLVPLRLVVLGRKRVPQKGIFWRSVLDSTGQPAELGGPLAGSIKQTAREDPC